MVLYGVVDRRLHDIVEFFATRSGAEAFIDECLTDEPEWRDFLAIEAVEFETSPN